MICVPDAKGVCATCGDRLSTEPSDDALLERREVALYLTDRARRYSPASEKSRVLFVVAEEVRRGQHRKPRGGKTP